MKLLSVAKYKNVVEMNQKMKKQIKGILCKTVTVVKLLSVAKCKMYGSETHLLEVLIYVKLCIVTP